MLFFKLWKFLLFYEGLNNGCRQELQTKSFGRYMFERILKIGKLNREEYNQY
jgi:hypothetical protein